MSTIKKFVKQLFSVVSIWKFLEKCAAKLKIPSVAIGDAISKFVGKNAKVTYRAIGSNNGTVPKRVKLPKRPVSRPRLKFHKRIT